MEGASPATHPLPSHPHAYPFSYSQVRENACQGFCNDQCPAGSKKQVLDCDAPRTQGAPHTQAQPHSSHPAPPVPPAQVIGGRAVALEMPAPPTAAASAAAAASTAAREAATARAVARAAAISAAQKAHDLNEQQAAFAARVGGAGMSSSGARNGAGAAASAGYNLAEYAGRQRAA